MKAIWLVISFAAFVGCASIKELEEKIDGLQKQNSSLQSSYNQQIRITKELEEKIDGLQKQNDQPIKALIKISDELNIKIIDDLQKNNTFLKRENAALQTDITRLQGETASLTRENGALQTDITRLQGETASLTRENGALQTDITRLQGETASLRKNTIDEIRRLKSQITEKEHELKGLRKIE